ncbi:CHASE2 domain-containing protein [Neptuniibacter caesariensis]|uniref:Adenylyl cyclase class-3/4/guanylyl cyclase n=1 Tax=Neptuniibacter caesariensis TaxID=207954 RepID=A0A7U8C6E9_NEPCE|nr:adenylate/guanylate cyclase domain-containing protein [Neptuniibacter caesariensis]EAR62372.1 adenylyl cyclase class-3/4/guanylyl cyclase [Oceanospirillum sp. MED92] [Neptuniibacter caesariensis]
MKQRWIRTVLGLLLTLIMLIPVIQGDRPELLERFEYDLYDIRLKQFLADDKDPRIVIVDVDEKSLATEGRWPWNRTKLALMLDQLFDQYGVAIVGFDMVFSEADQSVDLGELKQYLALSGSQNIDDALAALDSDQHFTQAVQDRPVVLGYLFDRSPKKLQIGHPGSAVISHDPTLDRLPIPEANGVISSLNRLQNVAVWNGFFDNPMVDSDGVYRRVPVLQRYQDEYYPSLALAMLLALFAEESVAPIVETDATGERNALVAVDAAGMHIPVDQHGAVLVPYRGPQGSFPYISATDVIRGTADPSQLEGAIVLVGTSAAGLLDLRVTPMSNRYSGVEVHANILSGMLDERIQHQPDYTLGVELVQLLVSGILLSLIIPRTSVLISTLITFAWVGAIVAANLYAWSEMLWVIPLGYTLIMISVLYLFQQTTGYFFEARNKAQLANQFGQYIPPEVVEELSQQDQSVQLTGENREMTVFFSDVRGFTHLSEQLNPQQLTRLMNIYLSGMTKIIHEQKGTVDKYIGDAVMAFWGAPLKDENHARHALQSALKMIEVLPQLNQELAREDLPMVSVGMGINSGPMNVGNMGSNFRMAYTVMGDSVNLASRLEGLTKYYGVPLLVSGELASQVPEYLYRKLDRVQVKGRTEPVDILEPICLLEKAEKFLLDGVELFSEARDHYQSQQWQKAKECFAEYLKHYPSDEMSKIYIDRITEFEREAPGEGWCGVYSHTSK